MFPSTLLRLIPIVLSAMPCVGPVAAAAAPDATTPRADRPDDAPKTGAFQTRIPQRSKSSAILGITARMGWGGKAEVEAAAKKDGGEVDYDLSGETFDVFVPEDYTGKEPYGLIVWINPGRGGAPRADWLDVLRKHKLIWIGATHTGNDRTKWVRLGLAIDAAEHMQKAYKIDPARVYASGSSGGGRCASLLAIGFPDVFTGGGYPIIGTNYFRIVEVGQGKDGRREWYQRYFDRPSAKLMALATKERRFVLLTGDDDGNRQQTQLYAEAMKKDGFKYVTYLQVPGMGHQAPDAEWFEKGIVALDASRDEVVKAAQELKSSKPQAGTSAKAPPLAASRSAPAPTAPAPKPPVQGATPPAAEVDEEADKLMRLARLYLDNRMYKKAREKLNEIVKNHPTSPPAAEAKKLLAEIGAK
jgi:hypothetical protein